MPEGVAVEEQAEMLLAVHEALEGLATLNERLSQVVECRYFAGSPRRRLLWRWA
jgi:hypothetical protein